MIGTESLSLKKETSESAPNCGPKQAVSLDFQAVFRFLPNRFQSFADL
jgi:hypothetical protein